MTTEIFMASGEAVIHVTVAPGEYIIGRDGEVADIHIDDPSVSASHARLVVENETVCIQDLDSENGTFIDGEAAISLTNLYDGQTAVLGTVSLRVRQNVDPRLLGEGPRYVRGGMVAHGGMGAIHEARQSAMGRKVAMKVMLHSWSSRSVRRFLDEARITGMLEHPNIVPVHEMGVDEEDQFFYTMKFVKGATLSEVLAGLAIGNAESVRRFPLAALLTIFQKVCDAVAFAHSRGVWHRDLKPENIMIGDFGEVLVMDWGLAKESGFAAGELAPAESELPATEEQASSETISGRTMEGTVIGTPAYMAPEQARGQNSDVDYRSDIYALGAILHEILYLQAPVTGKNRDKVLEKVAAGAREIPVQSPALHLPAQRVPASMEAVCRKAMAADRYQRYQRVQDLQADIAAYQSGFATSAEGAGLAKHLLLFIKRNRSVSVVTLLGLLTLVASSVFFTVNLVRERNRAETAKNAEMASRLVAEENQQKAENALKEALEAKGKADAADRDAKDARNRAETAKNAEMASRLVAEENQKKLEETTTNLAGEFSRMARIAVLEGRPEDALQLFSTAVEQAPGNAEYVLQHGLALLALGYYQDAAARFESALRAGAEVRAELDKAREMQSAKAKNGELSPESSAELERFFMKQGHGPYVLLMDAKAESGRAGMLAKENAPALLEGDELIKLRLGKIVDQPEWREDRIRQPEKGSYALDLSGLDLKNLPGLAGTGVVELNISGTKVADISGLRGLSLRSLDLRGTEVSDLAPLRNMPLLAELRCGRSVADLSPLVGAPLESLDLTGSQVKDLEPLRDARLSILRLGGCEIATLEPVSAQPIQELDANVAGDCDLASIKAMTSLVKLRLPPRTGMFDVSALPALEEIFIPDIKADGAMSGDQYRELDALRAQLWDRYGKELEKLPLLDFGPERLLVRQKTGFDLDLRGTGIKDLSPLAKIPLNRLFVDTASEPVDVNVLGSHQTLRHLSLEGAWVKSIGGLAANRQLESLVLSRDTADTTVLARHPGLRRLGYALGEDGLSPAGSVAEFFAPRVEPASDSPTPDKQPKYFFSFDKAVDGTEGWKIDDSSNPPPAALWMADPQVEGGGGGGYMAFYERKGNNLPSYFTSSPAVDRNQRDLFGGLIEFRIRVGRALKKDARAAVIIVAGDRTLHHSSTVRPDVKWQTVFVPLSVAGSWSVNAAGGPAATEVDLRECLSRVRQIRIQAEFAADELDERTDLDDVRIWDEKTGEGRRLQLESTL